MMRQRAVLAAWNSWRSWARRRARKKRCNAAAQAYRDIQVCVARLQLAKCGPELTTMGIAWEQELQVIGSWTIPSLLNPGICGP